jgi:hypothetical protein
MHGSTALLHGSRAYPGGSQEFKAEIAGGDRRNRSPWSGLPSDQIPLHGLHEDAYPSVCYESRPITLSHKASRRTGSYSQ